MEDVYALGDCAGFLEHTGRPVLPALAQVSCFFYICDSKNYIQICNLLRFNPSF